MTPDLALAIWFICCMSGLALFAAPSFNTGWVGGITAMLAMKVIEVVLS